MPSVFDISSVTLTHLHVLCFLRPEWTTLKKHFFCTAEQLINLQSHELINGIDIKKEKKKVLICKPVFLLLSSKQLVDLYIKCDQGGILLFAACYETNCLGITDLKVICYTVVFEMLIYYIVYLEFYHKSIQYLKLAYKMLQNIKLEQYFTVFILSSNLTDEGVQNMECLGSDL